MTTLTRIIREPARLIALIAAVVPVLIAAGVPEPLSIAAGGLVSALVWLLRDAVTPAREVAVQVKPDGSTVLGPAYNDQTVTVTSNPAPGDELRVDLPPTDRGATDAAHALIVVLILAVFALAVAALAGGAPG